MNPRTSDTDFWQTHMESRVNATVEADGDAQGHHGHSLVTSDKGQPHQTWGSGLSSSSLAFQGQPVKVKARLTQGRSVKPDRVEEAPGRRLGDLPRGSQTVGDNAKADRRDPHDQVRQSRQKTIL